MSMMTLQKSKMKCASETQKSNYLENETLYFLQIKKFSWALIYKKMISSGDNL